VERGWERERAEREREREREREAGAYIPLSETQHDLIG
jgi:hypothetical protein